MSETVHGDVCVYLNELIPFTVLDDFNDKTDDLLEVLWIKIRPTRLPRGASLILFLDLFITLQQRTTLWCWIISPCSCLSDLESKHPNSGIIVLGDLNQLNDSRLKTNFGLKQIVHFPTRGRNTLDKVLTNLKSYYDPPTKRPPFGLSDQFSVDVQPKQRPKSSQVKYTVLSRDLRPSNRLAMRTYLEQVHVADIINTASSCEEKTSLLQMIVKTGLDAIDLTHDQKSCTLPNRSGSIPL